MAKEGSCIQIGTSPDYLCQRKSSHGQLEMTCAESMYFLCVHHSSYLSCLIIIKWPIPLRKHAKIIKPIQSLSLTSHIYVMCSKSSLPTYNHVYTRHYYHAIPKDIFSV